MSTVKLSVPAARLRAGQAVELGAEPLQRLRDLLAEVGQVMAGAVQPTTPRGHGLGAALRRDLGLD